MSTRNCDDPTNNTCTDCIKAPLKGAYRNAAITVVGVTPDLGDPNLGMVTFEATATDGKVHKYEIKWGDEDVAWVYCPTTVISGWQKPNTPGPLPKIGAYGDLFVEVTANKSLKDVTVTLAPIRLGAIKYPRAASMLPEYRTLSVRRMTLVLTGQPLLPGGGIRDAVSIDLTNPDLAEPGQVIDSGADVVDVRLSAKGFAAANVPFVTLPVLEDAVKLLAGPPTADPKAIAAAWAWIARASAALDEHPEDPAFREKAAALIKQVVPAFLPGPAA